MTENHSDQIEAALQEAKRRGIPIARILGPVVPKDGAAQQQSPTFIAIMPPGARWPRSDLERAAIIGIALGLTYHLRHVALLAVVIGLLWWQS